MSLYRRISVSFYYCSLSRRSAERWRIPIGSRVLYPPLRRSSANVRQIHESWESGLITMYRIFAHEIIIRTYQMIFSYVRIRVLHVDGWTNGYRCGIFGFPSRLSPRVRGGILSKFIGQRQWFARLYRSLEYRVYL